MYERPNDFLLNVKSYVAVGMAISIAGMLGECCVKYGTAFLQFIHQVM